MNLPKVIGGTLVAIVLVVFGMNQYESYKLNSKANDTINQIESNMQEAENRLEDESVIANANSTIASVKSAIVSERQSRLITGDSSYIQSLSSNDTNLFDNILAYPISAGTSKGNWSKAKVGLYRFYTNKNVYSEFKYDNQNGNFTCISDCRYF